MKKKREAGHARAHVHVPTSSIFNLKNVSRNEFVRVLVCVR